jgi:hypothetical protein
MAGILSPDFDEDQPYVTVTQAWITDKAVSYHINRSAEGSSDALAYLVTLFQGCGLISHVRLPTPTKNVQNDRVPIPRLTNHP